MSTLLDFVMRSDSLTQKGGDTAQIAEYASRLDDRGYDIKIEPFRPGMTIRAGSIVHIVNIDRPYDYLETMFLAKDNKVIVSPIHHDLSAVRAMRTANTGEGIRSLFRRVLPERIVELLAYIVRSYRQTKEADVKLSDFIRASARALGHSPNVWKLVGKHLDASHAVALLANTEAESIKKDAGWAGANGHLVPNGSPERDETPNFVKPWADRDTPIICVGRIEPRKRQAEVAEIAAAQGIPIHFVGALASPETTYSKRFTDAVSANDGLEWSNYLPNNEVLSMYGNSKVLLNASWVEVQSLVDIEAASAGCFVVNAGPGSSREWLGPAVVNVPPGDVSAAVIAAHDLSKRAEGPGGAPYDRTWESAVKDLEGLYKA
jgi:glycosyltransferase involved in cell wall biosynthesis